MERTSVFCVLEHRDAKEDLKQMDERLTKAEEAFSSIPKEETDKSTEELKALGIYDPNLLTKDWICADKLKIIEKALQGNQEIHTMACADIKP